MVEAVINKQIDILPKAKQFTSDVKPEKRGPHYHIESPGILQQIDLIQFPNFEGFGSLLLIIDINNRLCDGRPLVHDIGRAEDALMINAVMNIYVPTIYYPNADMFGIDFSDNYRKNEDGSIKPWLEVPEILQGDYHFKGKNFIKFCNDNGIGVKISQPYRSNQNAYIEGINSWFRRQVNQYLLSESLKRDEKFTGWVEFAMMLIKTRNKYITDGLKGDVRNTKIPGYIVQNPKTSYIIENGTKIRVHLDRYVDFDRKKLKANNRGHSTIFKKWSTNNYVVDECVLIPGNPPLYYVRNTKTGEKLNASYPAEQLLILPKSSKP